ncbi:MAG: hypothetical protein ACKN95_00600, partial [Holophagaceae bacterium]
TNLNIFNTRPIKNKKIKAWPILQTAPLLQAHWYVWRIQCEVNVIKNPALAIFLIGEAPPRDGLF